MNTEAKAQYFDGIAAMWDGWEDLEALAEKLSRGLDEIGIRPDETIVDVGCGTGNLTLALLDKLTADGRVMAIDISAEMVKKARDKVVDPRVSWHVGDALRLPINNCTVDRVICCSVWPHFDDLAGAAEEFRRVLSPGGVLHVWHLSSRASINEIHANAGEVVANDVLAPGAQTARLLREHGLDPYEIVDNEERYLVSAQRPRDDS